MFPGSERCGKNVLRSKSGLKFALLISVSLGMLVGCSGETRLPVVPVQGLVSYQGKPLANALVVMHPVDKSNPAATTCRASTKSDGTFEVTTYLANDGAPVGEYIVTVECYQLKGGNGSWEPGPNILPPRYGSVATSDLKLVVQEGDNSVKKIELK
jgi:hypothetical protein